MLVAIPTVNNKLVTRRFGRMTEVTFVEIENHEVKNQFSVAVTLHHEHTNNDDEHHHHDHDGKHQRRHQDIKNKICKADAIVYKSLCKNWRARLQNCEKELRRTNNDLLVDVIEEIKNL